MPNGKKSTTPNKSNLAEQISPPFSLSHLASQRIYSVTNYHRPLHTSERDIRREIETESEREKELKITR